MKTKLLSSAVLALLVAAGFFGSVVALSATQLKETTAVHTRADAASPTITVLPAGSDPIPYAEAVATTPAGWMAVEVPGPFDVYVLNKDLAKSLDVKPGSNLYFKPAATSDVLTVSQRDDKIKITGLNGKYTRVSLDKKLVGYIPVTATPGYMPSVATTPAGSMPVSPNPAPAPAPLSPPPVTPHAYGSAEAGKAAPMIDLSTNGAAIPRQFAGKFVSTRSPFHPRRPYDWALNDDSGKRYAYLDVSKLLLTEQIEKYVGHDVVVFGAASATSDGKDILISVETLQLK